MTQILHQPEVMAGLSLALPQRLALPSRWILWPLVTVTGAPLSKFWLHSGHASSVSSSGSVASGWRWWWTTACQS